MVVGSFDLRPVVPTPILRQEDEDGAFSESDSESDK
jgi:hypothetical protein